MSESSDPSNTPAVNEPTPSAAVDRTSGQPNENAVTVYRIPGTPIVLEMISVPASTFLIGSLETDPGSRADERPQKQVSIAPFQMSRYEISHDAYTIFRYPDRDSDSTAIAGVRFDVDAVARPSTPYEDPSHGMGGRGYPAVGMTQWGSLHFAKWVSDKTGAFFRLPTEAEWEYVCKAGSFGNDPDDVASQAWYSGNSDGALKKIGTRSPNALGIYDLLGNAAEWTLDQYDAEYYASLDPNSSDNPWRKPDALHPRTVRGGSYADDLTATRCSSRQESDLVWKRRDPQIPKSFWWNTDSPFVGFRLVRPVNPPSPQEQIEFWQLVLGE